MVRVERSNSDVSGGEEAFNESDDEEADEESELAPFPSDGKLALCWASSL